MRVLVWMGNQVRRLVEAWMMMVRLLGPVRLKANWLPVTPRLAPVVWGWRFSGTAGAPPKVLLQPVVLGEVIDGGGGVVKEDGGIGGRSVAFEK